MKVTDAQIEIGQTYRIREWDDMVKEYGMTSMEGMTAVSFGWPNNTYLTEKQKYLCGRAFTPNARRCAKFSRESIPFVFYTSEEAVEKIRSFEREDGKICTQVIVIVAEMLELFDPIMEKDFLALI